MNDFKNTLLQGIPNELPEAKTFDTTINHAPKRKDIKLYGPDSLVHDFF